MIKIDTIRVRTQNSQIDLSKVKQILEDMLSKNASATSYRSWQEKDAVKLLLYKTISITTFNKILNCFSKENFKIKKFSWEENQLGPVKRGAIEVIIS